MTNPTTSPPGSATVVTGTRSAARTPNASRVAPGSAPRGRGPRGRRASRCATPRPRRPRRAASRAAASRRARLRPRRSRPRPSRRRPHRHRHHDDDGGDACAEPPRRSPRRPRGPQRHRTIGRVVGPVVGAIVRGCLSCLSCEPRPSRESRFEPARRAWSRDGPCRGPPCLAPCPPCLPVSPRSSITSASSPARVRADLGRRPLVPSGMSRSEYRCGEWSRSPGARGSRGPGPCRSVPSAAGRPSRRRSPRSRSCPPARCGPCGAGRSSRPRGTGS